MRAAGVNVKPAGEGLDPKCADAMAVNVAWQLTFHGLALTGGVVSVWHGSSGDPLGGAGHLAGC